tara:strand:+ start:1761 stop:2822 length:1062 start_codon:yes stop_codon:yes gene_type:complete
MPQLNDISADWLTDVFRSENVISSTASIKSYETKVLTGGLMADTLRLTLEYVNGNGTEPGSVVGKFPSSNPDSRAAGHEMAAYSKEVNFYKHLSKQLSMRAPICYYASIDEETSDFVLILEDVSPAIVATPETENAKDLMLLSMEELALLHGDSRGKPDIERHANHGQVSDKKMIGAVTTGWDILKQAADERLPAASIAAGDTIVQNIEKLHNLQKQNGCLVHGDYRFPNILYRGNDEAITVDWQTYQWQAAGIDLAHGIINSLELDLAREHYEECLSRYHQKMVDLGFADYSIDDCYYDFKVGILSDMEFLMLTTCSVGSSNLSDAARNQILNACHRVWAFADDLNALEVLK